MATLLVLATYGGSDAAVWYLIAEHGAVLHGARGTGDVRPHTPRCRRCFCGRAPSSCVGPNGMTVLCIAVVLGGIDIHQHGH